MSYARGQIKLISDLNLQKTFGKKNMRERERDRERQCVREREKEREKVRERERERDSCILSHIYKRYI